MRKPSLWIALLLLGITSIGDAQTRRPAGSRPTGGRSSRGRTAVAVPVYGGSGYGGGYGYGGYGSSTAGEGYAHGMADVVRSQGAANLMNSVAAGNFEDARSKNLANQLQYTETYFEKRRINQQYRQAERDARMSNPAAYAAARERPQKRLTSTQLDPLTGTIQWPAVLNDDQYAEARTQLEQIFAMRANDGQSASVSYSNVRQYTDELTAALGMDLRAGTLADADFLTAKKFVEALAYEARFPNS